MVLNFYTISLILVLVFLIRRYSKHIFSYWTYKGVVSIPASIQFGNLIQQVLQFKSQGQGVSEYYFYLERQGLKYGGVYSFTRPVLIVIDPELIKTILVKEFTSFQNRSFTISETEEPLFGHLFLLKGAKWRFLRTKLTPTFTSGKMKMMFNTVLECAHGLEPALELLIRNGKSIDVKDILSRYTIDVIGSCAFGLECNSLKDPDAEFARFGKILFKFSFLHIVKRIIASIIPSIAKLFKFNIVETPVKEFFMDAIKQTVEYRERNQIERNDFMDLLIKLKNNENIDDGNEGGKVKGPAITFNQLAAQCFVFFFAGFETSSSAMTYCLYELCKNEDVQEKLKQEVKETLMKCNGELTYEAVMEMPYMDKVIKETLRKYPIVPILHRECSSDFKMPDNSGLVIENGTAILISVLGLHHNPKYYPHPLKFDPERFSDEAKSGRHPYVYLPFGEGPRNCIGMRFGVMQTKVGLALLLKHFKFTLNEKTTEPFIYDSKSFILSVKNGIWLNAKKC